ncbi:predicted protein [Lichtheimia corymbifera JMRC:FSU:9682]|uniref:Kelch repeat protein n=1 Tax=Lichtheimia corymbifera JMRC:FSU:9682 TaxID=1263082 RepID=A0A068S5P6_9FUNG|nr:predicted protein [Lichtheimia corymbifera JMRC:FSU:9682]
MLTIARNAMAMLLLLLISLVAQHPNQVAAGNAPPAYGGRCAYADYKIYCYGGATSILNDLGLKGTQQFFALNISDPITVAANSSSWYTIDFTGQTVQPEPNVFFSMAAIDKPDQKYLVIMGGGGKNDGTAMQHPAIYYDIEAGLWNTIDSSNHPQKRFQSLIFDEAGSKDRFFVWGGDRSASTGYWNETSNNDDVPFDMAVLSDKWEWSSPTNNIQNLSLLMLPRTQHAAAQGGDGRIYITGGLEAYANVSSNGSVAYEFYSASMTDTMVYDINNGWDIKNTTGDIPSERMFHTMVTSTDGKSILLYGGADTLFGSNNLPLPSRDVAYVLDISDPNNLVWKNVTNTLIQNSGPFDRYLRFHHNAILLNSSLFILFGGNSGGVQQDFFIIDVDNWNLTNSFAGANLNGNGADGGGGSGSSSGISGGAIAGIVVGVVVGVGVIVGAIVFFFIRRKRQAKKPSEKRDYVSDSKDGGSNEPMHQSFLPPSYQEAANQRQEYLSSSNISEPPHTSTASPTRSSMEQQAYLMQQQQAIKPHSDAYQRSSNAGLSTPQQPGTPEVYVPRLKLMPVKPDGE